jgi:hypothetical protein
MSKRIETRGRKRIPKITALGKFISTRLTPTDYKAIHEAIARSDQSKSEWIRDALLERVKKENSSKPSPSGGGQAS